MTSATAEYMALFRALESTAPLETRLFDDPYAVRFLRPSLRHLTRFCRRPFGHSLVRAALDRLWPGARASGIARTRLIDDALVTAAAEGRVEQVVFLGAGFDCRAHRQSLRSSPVYLEVDRPETQERKRKCLADLVGNPVRYAPCDFETDSISSSLESAGFNPERASFFVWEGVTNYLDPKTVDEVFEYVSSCAPGSVLLFTYVDRLVLDEPERFAGSRRLQATLRSSDEPWTFGIDPASLADFLERRGLHLVFDEGSVDYRARYLGGSGAHLRGYEFYRAAMATVTDTHRVVGPCGE